MHDISVAAVAALLMLSCQGDSAKSRPAPGAGSAKSGAGKMVRSGGGLVVDEAPAPSFDLDCAALLTSRDFFNMCGVKDSAWEKDPFETGKGPSTCSRRTGAPGRQVRFAVGVYPHVESARSVTRGVKPGAVELETKSAKGATSTTAHMRRGNIAVSVTATHAGSETPLCSGDQLGKLAMVIDSRLP